MPFFPFIRLPVCVLSFSLDIRNKKVQQTTRQENKHSFIQTQNLIRFELVKNNSKTGTDCSVLQQTDRSFAIEKPVTNKKEKVFHLAKTNNR